MFCCKRGDMFARTGTQPENLENTKAFPAALAEGTFGCVSASCQTTTRDLQACKAVQMWNRRASVIVYPLVCRATVSCPGLPSSRLATSFHSTLSTSPLVRPFTPTSGGGSCSIPAGPCLFISSEVLMINEALNTSSISLGPGEPHS